MYLKTLFIFLIINFVSDSYGRKAKKFYRKDYNYMDKFESFYKIHTNQEKWADAKKVCAQEGAILWHPDNDVEADELLSLCKTKNIERLHVGLSDLLVEGVFETVDGKSISEVYNNWQQGQPDNYQGKQHCGVIGLDGTLDDEFCDLNFAFVCKKSLQSLERSFQCKKPDLDGKRAKKFFRKDYDYLETFESFYKIHTNHENWADAKRVCALERATLWHPDNDDEANELLSLCKTKNIERLHVGLSDLLVEGVFETVDGKSISEVYHNWQSGQPDNYRGKQHCGVIRLDGTLDDEFCDLKFAFICKKSLQSLEWNYQCNMPDLDYIYNKDTGKCYKVHATPLTWPEAHVMCQVEQSSLAIIRNRLEANYVARLTELTTKPRVRGKYQRGIYHLGFHNRLNDGWQTISGTLIDDDQDIWYDENCPDGNDPEECGSMLYTGRLINIDCDTKSFFICEHVLSR